MNDNDLDLLTAYAALDSAVVSDALDGLGLPPGLGGLVPLWGRTKIVGFAATVELGPADKSRGGAHIASTAVAEAGPEDVMVVANGGRTDVSCWGGLLSLGARQRGVRGVVADGVCRDVDEANDLAFPVFARGSIPVTARGRLRQVSAGAPVRVGPVTVATGDVVIADRTGVVFVPKGRTHEVLRAAKALALRELAIAEDLLRGVALPEAMRDARLAGERA